MRGRRDRTQTQLPHEKRIYLAGRGANVPRNKTSREDTFMKHLSTLAAGLLIGTAAFQSSNSASGQSEGGWVTLLDSTKMGDWDEAGKANWAMKDAALTADRLDANDLSYL